MPTYDYVCECGKQKEELRRIADRDMPLPCECGKEMHRKFSFTKSRDWFRPHWNEDLDYTPVYIESKQQYKEECKKRGVMARCLL